MLDKRFSFLISFQQSFVSPRIYIYFYNCAVGLSQLNSNDIENSIASFEMLLAEKDSKFYNDLLYNLGLAYAKNGNILKPRRTLKELNRIECKYSNKHPELFNDLRWF